MIFGLKMRYNEPFRLGTISPGMIELHLADEDLHRHRHEIMDRVSVLPEVPLVIHAPMNLYLPTERPPLVDLSSASEKQRLGSLEVIRSSLDLLGDLNGRYLVVHPGGQSPTPPRDSEPFMERLITSLETLEQDYSTKLILMENMPWHYWMWGGEELWYSPILRKPGDFSDVLEYTHICLDICHAYLAEPAGTNRNIFDFLDRLQGRIKHLHLSDARAPHGEGLQPGDGEIEFGPVLRRVLDLEATAIPEIHDGHLHDREGFREAMDRFGAILAGRFSR